jgi:hypothetical protein
LTKTGNFKRAIKTLADKGTKAMYEILKRGKFHNLSISCQLDLFDKVVKLILRYGCELCGLSNCDIIERVSFTISISLLLYVNCNFCGNLPFVKHTILVLSIFIFNFQDKQQS